MKALIISLYYKTLKCSAVRTEHIKLAKVKWASVVGVEHCIRME
jgi:hypothetical protein